ncbi:MAG: hypothetical protein VW687_14970, partial [Curvibacter sp.]
MKSLFRKSITVLAGLGLLASVSLAHAEGKIRVAQQFGIAYLILDVVQGDKRLFIRNDELEEAWKLFTPLLKTIEDDQMAPELYP